MILETGTPHELKKSVLDTLEVWHLHCEHIVVRAWPEPLFTQYKKGLFACPVCGKTMMDFWVH